MLSRRSAAWLAMMFLIMGSLVFAADDPSKKADVQKKPKAQFTISKETTYVTGPLREGGYIDYVAALNERMKQGVTPENNAMVLLVRALGPAMGPAPKGAKVTDRYFKALGCEVPPEEGKYYREFNQILKDSQKPAMEFDQLWDHLRRLAGRPWSRKEFPVEARWVDGNEECLRLVYLASLQSDFYSPVFTPHSTGYNRGIFSMVNPTDRVRDLAQLLSCRAMLLTQEGKYPEAKQDILTCHRLARLVSRGATSIDLLAGEAIETYAVETAIAWLGQPMLPTNLILEYQRELAILSTMAKLHDKIDGAERFFFLDTILLVAQNGFKVLEQLAGGGVNGDALGTKVMDLLLFQDLDWNPALKKANPWYDRLVAAFKNTDHNERIRATKELEDEIQLLRKKLATELMGRIAESKESRVLATYDMTRCLLTPVLLKIQISADQVEQHQRHLQLAIALALYHREKGLYPEKLSELIPKCLSTIPLDLFSGKDVIYFRTAKGYRLYSVGPNGKDDGGVKDDEYPHKVDDIVVEMPLPEWKKK